MPDAVETEAPEALIEEEKATAVAPELPKVPIEEEKTPEIAPKAVEIPTQEDVAGPREDLSAIGTKAREALIAV